MGTAINKDIRKEVKKYIDQADDRMVKIIHAMLEADRMDDWWDEIGADEKAAIEIGRRQLDEGNGIPHEELVKRYPKYLKA